MDAQISLKFLFSHIFVFLGKLKSNKKMELESNLRNTNKKKK